MKNKGLKTLIIFIILFPLVLTISSCGPSKLTYKYEGDLDYSATVTLEILDGGGYDLYYEGDDDFLNPQHQLSVDDKYMFYKKTIDGEDYYAVYMPDPFNSYYWILSSDRKTLKYGNILTFYLQ